MGENQPYIAYHNFRLKIIEKKSKLCYNIQMIKNNKQSQAERIIQNVSQLNKLTDEFNGLDEYEKRLKQIQNNYAKH